MTTTVTHVPGQRQPVPPAVLADPARIYAGVDTHADTHTAVALDGRGGRLGALQIPTEPAGYATLTGWLTGFGPVAAVGIEGTSSYGAALTRHLYAAGVTVIEVDRPDRAARRRAGKSDPLDAEAAARAVLSGRATGTPKTSSGEVESIRLLRILRRTLVDARKQAMQKIKSILVTAPDDLRTPLRSLPDRQLITSCARLRPDPDRLTDPNQAAKRVLRSLARRWQDAADELTDLDMQLTTLIDQVNPRLLQTCGIGVATASQLLVTAGQNPDRMHTEAAFAMLCGVAPVPASSGKTSRHRLNRGGDRDANCAIHHIALTRKATDQKTRAYITRRRTEGLTNRDATRCLKRAIAREIWHLLTLDRP